ncbi:MAG TPA: 4-(cytidine 5'-diphospho)-2-C-methyl-D-erythritol kinase [Allosphingosinicella sp.]|nr:4-(cytidine 5'-diphospho)-2-C-methyl-D-erythritol kinase [Allosphingosinicella sp.]
MEEIGYAKINLALHVRAREQDGYHRIETVFAFCEDGDRLTIQEGDGLGLDVRGRFADALAAGERNLVLRAAEELGACCEASRGAALALDKKLPVAAGLGGGSADAAATLRLLCRWWDIRPGDEALHAIARGLGADVSACLASRTVRGEGRGDRLRHWEGNSLAGRPVLLVNPGVPLSTAAVFAAWEGVDRGALERLDGSRNDLEPAAIALVPEIAEVLAALDGAALARMSGSGATCFGLYESEQERDAAAARIRAARSGWWTLATRLR